MRILSILSTAAVLAIPATATMIAVPAWAEAAQATISVTGDGSVSVAPDMATVSLGVTTEADTAKAAMTANNEALTTVIERLKSAGVEARDIQTSGLSLGPRFDYSVTSSSGSQAINGYIASNMLTVRVQAIDTVGGVLDAVITDGANTLNGVTFGLKDSRAATDEARKTAITDARRKAELYAAEVGAKLGRVVSISEQNGFMSPMPMGAAAFDKASDVPVAQGELSVGASVGVVFEMLE